MSDLQPITVYVHIGGPNPYKVTIILEELEIPYKKIVVANPKEEWFVAINPNGRVPAIIDPNTNLTIWESGAILEYLVETYDKKNELTATDAVSKWQIKQLLHFQMSGQGPYFGQAIWFHKCPEDMPLAKARYHEQILRVFEVLDNMLKGKTYLLGDKLTYVDLSFVPWSKVAMGFPLLSEMWANVNVSEKYPNFMAWHERLIARPSVQKAYSA